MAKKIEDKYKKLTDREHVLLRPGMYLGSIKPSTIEKWVFEDDKITKKVLTHIPAFVKLFDEIITNSIDESKRDGSKLNLIKINIDNDIISVWDNGGIEVTKNIEDEWIPEMIFSNMRAGSNFSEDDNRTWAGTHGVGSSCTNIFSTEFTVSTCDGKNSFIQTFSNNMRDRTTPIIKKSKTNHTQITFKPDYEKFGLDGLDNDHFKMIEKRVYDLAACNTHLKIYLNDKLIEINSFEDYIKFYKDEYFFESRKDKKWSLGVALSDNGFQQISFVNSTETYDGGTHLDYITNQIVSQVREFFLKKHKVDIKPSEIKNHMFIFLDATVINPSFSSQTKEKMITESKDFGFTFEVSSKLIQNILKSEIVNSILDWIQQKKNAEDNKLQRELNKKLSKIKVEKLIDAKGKDRMKCQLFLYEGDSASSAHRKFRVPEIMGAFSLRGKFINVSEITNQKLVQNTEAVNMMAAIGLKLGQPVDKKSLRYGNIFIAADADQDGNSISALLINFFYKFWPELFEMKMVYKVETPLLTATNKKTKKKLIFYNQTEYDKFTQKENLLNWEIKYKKGLGALVDDEYKEMINNPQLTLITKDDASKSGLTTWFGKDPEVRKNELLK